MPGTPNNTSKQQAARLPRQRLNVSAWDMHGYLLPSQAAQMVDSRSALSSAVVEVARQVMSVYGLNRYLALVTGRGGKDSQSRREPRPVSSAPGYLIDRSSSNEVGRCPYECARERVERDPPEQLQVDR